MSNVLTVPMKAGLLTLLLFNASCSNSTKAHKAPLSTTMAAQLSSQGQITEASEMYARMGELLLATPEGMLLSNNMFQKALELDIRNDKANLYSALISPMLSAKGFVPRFKNLTAINQDEVASLEKLEQKIKESGVKEFIEFALVMPEGKTPARTMEDIRKFYRHDYAGELSKSLIKLDNIKSEKFSLDLNIAAYVKQNQPEQTYCEVKEDQLECDDTFMTKDQKERIRIFVDQHDVKALKVLLKTQKNAIVLAYSVGLEGWENVRAKIEKISKPSDRDIINAIKSEPGLLKFDGNKDDVRDLFQHTEEVMNDLIDFSKISTEICSAENRTSNLVKDICVSEAAAEKISEVLMYVVGPKSVVLGQDENQNEVTVEVDLRAMINSKITSLQDLLPVKFDKDGKALDVADATFGGIIPNGDLISKLKTVKRK